MIRTQPPMTDEQAFHSDALYRARWQSLLSVDDMVEGVTAQVEAMGETHKTYFVFSSDHGKAICPAANPLRAADGVCAAEVFVSVRRLPLRAVPHAAGEMEFLRQ